MTKRKRNIARLVPEQPNSAPPRPDFLARLKKIYKKTLKVAGSNLISSERDKN